MSKLNNWDKQIKSVVNLFKKHNKGETITHEIIEMLLGIDRNSSEYLYITSRARQELIQVGIITKSILYQGYKILKSNEVAGFLYEKYLMASLKKQESALNIIKYVDTTELTNAEIKELDILNNLIGNVNRYSTGEVVKAQLLLDKAKTMALGGENGKQI